jgi:hypothetical protein
VNERSEPKLTERVFRLWRKERATRTPRSGVSRSQENTSRLRNNAKRSINYTGRPHRQASSASFLFFFLMPPPSVSKTTRRIARSPSAHPPSSPRGDKNQRLFSARNFSLCAPLLSLRGLKLCRGKSGIAMEKA